MWLEILGFKDLLKKWWIEIVVEGSTSFIFAQKLKLLKDRIVKWKKEEFREGEWSQKIVMSKQDGEAGS